MRWSIVNVGTIVSVQWSYLSFRKLKWYKYQKKKKKKEIKGKTVLVAGKNINLYGMKIFVTLGIIYDSNDINIIKLQYKYKYN